MSYTADLLAQRNDLSRTVDALRQQLREVTEDRDRLRKVVGEAAFKLTAMLFQFSRTTRETLKFPAVSRDLSALRDKLSAAIQEDRTDAIQAERDRQCAADIFDGGPF